MLSCVVLDDYGQVAQKFGDWSVLANDITLQVISEHISDEDYLIELIKGCDILVVMRERTPITASLISRLTHLKLIITTGTRNQSIDIRAAQEHGIMVCGTEILKQPTVELTWALILSLARDIPEQRLTHDLEHQWITRIGCGLENKILGIVGLGSIGQKVARIGSAFGMQMYAWSHNLTEARAMEHGCIRTQSLYELMEISDFVTIHQLLSSRTNKLIDKRALDYIKPTAYLINPSRSAIIDIPALITKLNTHELAGAALDVFDEEPLPMDSPLRTIPNLIATPHLGYATDDNYSLFFPQIIENIQAFINKNPCRQISVSA